MSVFRQIIKWFVEMVWPQIKRLITKVIVELVQWILEQIMQLIKDRFNRQENFASSNANAEYQKAKDSTSRDEAEMHYKMAEMWREVADNFREENDRLKEDLNNIMREAATKAAANVKDLQVDDVFDLGKTDSPTLKSDFKILPALEDPNSKRAS